MNNGPAYSYRKFAAGSAAVITTGVGATLKGVWISTKGTTPTVRFDDAVASVTATSGSVIPTTTLTAIGWQEMGGINTGTGLFFRAASCTGTIVYTPGGGG